MDGESDDWVRGSRQMVSQGLAMAKSSIHLGHLSLRMSVMDLTAFFFAILSLVRACEHTCSCVLDTQRDTP
jgi:hypothetical protein